MSYSAPYILYEDKPSYNLLLKVVQVLVPASLLVGAIYSAQQGEGSDALGLLIEGLVIGLLFWIIFPRRYQVFPDHVRIALGGPFSIKVQYGNVESISATSGVFFGISFATAIARKHVEIRRKRGARIGITPKDAELFAEQANRAFKLWRLENPGASPSFQP